MNPSNPAVELQNATSRLLRCRLPLLLALIVNVTLVARWPLVQLGAIAPQPASSRAVASALPLSGHDDAVAPSPTVVPQSTPAIAPTTITEPTRSTSPSEPTAVATCAPAAIQEVNLPATEPKVAVPPTSNVTEAPAANTPSENTHAPSVTSLKSAADRWWPAIASAWQLLPTSSATKPRVTGLTIRNLPGNEVPVRFLVNGRIYSLLPGESHSFADGTSWDLQYHHGGAFGNARQTLNPGDYQFVVGNTGWSLEPVR
jgi:hypothetical protein